MAESAMMEPETLESILWQGVYHKTKRHQTYMCWCLHRGDNHRDLDLSAWVLCPYHEGHDDAMKRVRGITAGEPLREVLPVNW